METAACCARPFIMRRKEAARPKWGLGGGSRWANNLSRWINAFFFFQFLDCPILSIVWNLRLVPSLPAHVTTSTLVTNYYAHSTFRCKAEICPLTCSHVKTLLLGTDRNAWRPDETPKTSLMVEAGAMTTSRAVMRPFVHPHSNQQLVEKHMQFAMAMTANERVSIDHGVPCSHTVSTRLSFVVSRSYL